MYVRVQQRVRTCVCVSVSTYTWGEMLGLRVCKSVANPVTNPNLQRFATFARVKTLNLHTWQTRWQMWQWPRSRTSQICCKFVAN